jgi:hypothetical protein
MVEKCCELCRHPNIINTLSKYFARLLVYCGMEITWRYIESVKQTVFKGENTFKNCPPLGAAAFMLPPSGKQPKQPCSRTRLHFQKPR